MDIVCDVFGVVYVIFENFRQIRDKGGYGWREIGVEVLVQIYQVREGVVEDYRFSRFY